MSDATDYADERCLIADYCLRYGPKQGEKAEINLIDPFTSALGRPSSAPIAHAVQRKFERQKHEGHAQVRSRK